MLAKLRSHLSYANVMVTALMFIVLGGGAYAALRLPANSVKSKHIAPNAARGIDINEASLDTSVLQSRVGGTCQEGQAIQSVLATGQVTCETALQGQPGTPGTPGAPGQPGADGTSFTWQGPWEEGREYVPNDVVSHQGSSWIATRGEPCEPGDPRTALNGISLLEREIRESLARRAPPVHLDQVARACLPEGGSTGFSAPEHGLPHQTAPRQCQLTKAQ